MGIQVSASYAVIALGVLISLGVFTMAVSNTAEQVSTALDTDQSREQQILETDITIISSEYRGTTLVLSARNTGQTDLTVSSTDILVDGRYVLEENRNSTVSGDGTTDIWQRGETLTLRVTLPKPAPERVKLVAEHGIAATEIVNVLALSRGIAFADSSGSLTRYGTANQFITYPGTPSAVGPPVSDFVAKNTTEVPAVNDTGDIVVATETGSQAVLTSGAKNTDTRLSVGRWQGSELSVFYVEANTSDILRVADDGATTRIKTDSEVDAEAVGGIADIDGDRDSELIYGGNSPDGVSNSIIYIDDTGTIVGTGVGYGTNNNIGLGEPADFDNDGTARVPYVDGSNNINLAANDGETTQLTSNGVAVKAPLATGNLDADAQPEIYFTSTDTGNLTVLDDVGVNNTVTEVTADGGVSTGVDDTVGIG